MNAYSFSSVLKFGFCCVKDLCETVASRFVLISDDEVFLSFTNIGVGFCLKVGSGV